MVRAVGNKQHREGRQLLPVSCPLSPTCIPLCLPLPPPPPQPQAPTTLLCLSPPCSFCTLARLPMHWQAPAAWGIEHDPSLAPVWSCYWFGLWPCSVLLDTMRTKLASTGAKIRGSGEECGVHRSCGRGVGRDREVDAQGLWVMRGRNQVVQSRKQLWLWH